MVRINNREGFTNHGVVDESCCATLAFGDYIPCQLDQSREVKKVSRHLDPEKICVFIAQLVNISAEIAGHSTPGSRYTITMNSKCRKKRLRHFRLTKASWICPNEFKLVLTRRKEKNVEAANSYGVVKKTSV